MPADTAQIELALFQGALTLVGLLFVALSVSQPWSKQSDKTRYKWSISLAIITILDLLLLTIVSLIVAANNLVDWAWLSYALFGVGMLLISIEFFLVSGLALGLRLPATEDIKPPIPPPSPP